MPSSPSAERHPLVSTDDGLPYLPEKTGSGRPSRLQTVLLVLNTLVLAAVLLLGVAAYRELQAANNDMGDVLRYFTQAPHKVGHGHGPLRPPPPQLVTAASSLLAAAVNEAFFLGASNGTVANFVTQFLGNNFGQLGATVAALSQSAVSVFNAPANACAGSTIVCPNSNMYIQCANGDLVYCNYQGESVQCGGSGCIAADLREVFSLMSSIATPISRLAPVATNATGTTPAFSDGVFRLNALIEWAKAQTNAGQWRRAARACSLLASQVTNINWAGTYIGEYGNQHNWDANSQVRKVVKHINEVCGPLSQL